MKGAIGLWWMRLRRAMRWSRLAVAGAVFLVASAGLVWWEVRPVGPQGGPRTVVIPPGTPAWQIGQHLAEAGLVRSARAFALAATLRRVTGRLRHGEYALRPTQSALEIADILARGAGILHRVTIPEGFTVAQIADVLAEAGLVDRERFLDLALRGGRRFSRPTLEGLPTDSLEGYLFPDTYHLPRGLDETVVIAHLLDRFDAADRKSVV